MIRHAKKINAVHQAETVFANPHAWHGSHRNLAVSAGAQQIVLVVYQTSCESPGLMDNPWVCA